MNCDNRLGIAALSGFLIVWLTEAAAQESIFSGNIGVDPNAPSGITFQLTDYLLTIENKEYFEGTTAGTVSNVEIGESGHNLGGLVTVSIQTIESQVTGITTANSIADASPDVTTGDAILSVQVIPESQIISTVADSRIGADLIDYYVGTISVDLNTVSTMMTINDVSNGLGLPSSSSNAPTSGLAIGSFDGTTITSDITDAFNSVNSIQQVIDSETAAGSLSAITGTDIGIEITESGSVDDDVAAIMGVSNNQIGATYTVNNASNGAGKTSSTIGSFVGSVIVSNGQLNATTTGTPDGALYSSGVLDSRIGATLPELVTGELAVSGNTILAWSTGNDAMNQIAFTDVNVTGEGASGAGGASYIVDTGTGYESSLAADLGVTTAQGNLNVTLQSVIGDFAFDASDTTVEIGGSVSGDFTAGSLVVSANKVQTQVYGNESSNSVTQSGIKFDATSAIGGYQTNDNSWLNAEVNNVQIGIALNSLGVDSIVSSKENTISSSLTGNSATNLISIASLEMTALNADGSASIYLDPAAYGQIGQSSSLPSTAGALITSLQSNYGGTNATSSVTNSSAVAILGGDVTGGSAISIGSNGISATTTGNTGINEVQFAYDPELDVPIGGVDATAGIGNLQFNDVAVSATLSDIRAGVYVEGTVSGLRILDVLEDTAIVSANGNSFSTTASGNGTSNLVTFYVNDLTNGGGTLADAAIDLNTDVVDASGGSVVANVQTNTTGSVESIIANSAAGVDIAGRQVTDALISAEKNTFTAMATGNSAVSNQVGAIGTKGSLSGAVASRQVNEVEVIAALEGVQVSLGVGNVADSTASLLNNTMTVQSTANSANNTFGAIGFTSLVLGTDNDTYEGSATIDTATGTASAEAATAVINSQVFTQNVSATIGAGTTLANGSQMVIDADDVSGGTVALNGDQMQVTATGNTVFNTLGLNGVKLGTGADTAADLYGALVNHQLNEDASVIATVTGHEIGAGFDSATDLSTLVVQQSGASATADGNVANNKILLAGTTHVASSPDSAGDDAYSFILLSEQIQSGADQEIQASITELDIGLSGTSASFSDLVVSSNVVTATAVNNTVLNSLEIAFETLTTSAAEITVQSAAAPVSATIADVNIGIALTGSAVDGLLTATGNVISAQATANSSNNEIDVAALSIRPGSNASMAQDFLLQASQENTGSVIATIADSGIGAQLGGALTGPLAAADSNIVGATGTGNTAINALKVASYDDSGLALGLDNTQTNTGAIAGQVENLSIALNAGGAAIGAMSVSGNSVAAAAYGNTAISTLNIVTLPSSVVSGGIANTQTNTADVTASITNLSIGITGGAGSAASPTVSRNVVSTYAVGNSAVNVVNRYNTGSAF